MRKYQTKVISIADDIINGMKYEDFFNQYQITDIDFVRTYISDLLTEKFINGELDDDDGIFTEDEFDKLLSDVINKHAIHILVEDGLINTYEDDTTDEVLFLTDKGKKMIEELKKK